MRSGQLFKSPNHNQNRVANSPTSSYNKDMYINNRPVAAFYKLAIGALSLLAAWFIVGQYGIAALRFFPTWVLFLSAIYFLSSSLYLAISHYKESGKNICPMLEGMLMMGFLLIPAICIFGSGAEILQPALPIGVLWLIVAILPLMVVGDWLLFVKKGRWRPMGPFYWLALPACYAATMVFTAELLDSGSDFLYPLGFLNFNEYSLERSLWWCILIIIVFLAVGYFLYIVDYIMSGKLSKRIVLPHLRVVETEEDHRRPSVKTKSSPALSSSRPQPSVQKSHPASRPQSPKSVKPTKSTSQPSKKSQSKSKPHLGSSSQKSSPKPRQTPIQRQDSSGTTSASLHSHKTSSSSGKKKSKS